MLTPAQRHWQRKTAEEMGAEKGRISAQALTQYERMRHRLEMDKRQLKNVQSDILKAELKRKLLPHYQGWIEGVLATGTGQPDEVFVICMIWHIDAGLIDASLDMAAYILRHHLAMPDQFARTPATFIVDAICDPVLGAFHIDATYATLSAATLRRLNMLTAAEDMPDIVRSKLYKCLGLTLRLGSLDDKVEAVEYLERAMQRHKKAGVKNDVRDLKKAIARQLEQQADATASE
ncbi:MAG: phage terminase small subunit [Ewingella sp.]